VIFREHNGFIFFDFPPCTIKASFVQESEDKRGCWRNVGDTNDETVSIPNLFL